MTATLTCFPLDVLRTRIMAPGGGLPSGAKLATALIRIVQAEGVGALYIGVLPAICSMAPSGAVFYGVYDLLKVSIAVPMQFCPNTRSNHEAHLSPLTPIGGEHPAGAV